MHTPEQAKDLWCPMGRVGVTPGSGGPSAVNDHTVEFRVNCIADRCAMWRWAYTTESVPDPIQGPSGAMVTTYRQEVVRTSGYCGLAGRPEVA